MTSACITSQFLQLQQYELFFYIQHKFKLLYFLLLKIIFPRINQMKQASSQRNKLDAFLALWQLREMT